VPADARTAPADVAAALAADPAISHVGFVTSETSSGVVHDAVTIGDAVRAAGRRAIVDAVSAFGAVPFDLASQPVVDALVFTANKCLEAPPGMAFVIGRIDRLEDCAGTADGWCFDLSDIHAHASGGNGAFRFTPPAQVIAALDVALDLYDAEGGQPARLARYHANMRVLYEGAIALGLRPSLPPELQGPIVLNVDAPDHPAWDLQRFVDALKARGVLISNFYNTEQPSFRVGCIGAVSPDEMRGALAAMGGALEEMGIRLRQAA
jgi:2-aminoethylphosphonate-pyruvate transaminase